ncbi:hypothetical protein [Ramlibacter sp.]|uniref:hypothetical protein n=1 Tax=Ramlibacter sp. TaxID=1917967 RepID=UPI002BF2B6C6|nr:hypothetical protein [Ramlibacter sp.]HWI84282.1 hypothetical protein [Ramlibacter sp.]
MTRLIALTLAAAAAIAAPALADTSLAGDISIDTTKMQSSTSRADVRADVAKATVTEWTRQRANAFENTGYTRAAARADYLRTRGENRMMTGEDSGSVYLSQGAFPVGTRAMGAGPR